MLNKTQFESLIEMTLSDLDEEARKLDSPVRFMSESAVRLLMITAAVESNFGTYLWQLGNETPSNAPGLGVFQIERATHDWLVETIRQRDKYNHIEQYLLRYVRDIEDSENLYTNLIAQIVFARLRYYLVVDPLPTTDMGLAEYWKLHYNTRYGKGTVKQAMERWRVVSGKSKPNLHRKPILPNR